jgi:hypothetical protein
LFTLREPFVFRRKRGLTIKTNQNCHFKFFRPRFVFLFIAPILGRRFSVYKDDLNLQTFKQTEKSNIFRRNDVPLDRQRE